MSILAVVALLTLLVGAAPVLVAVGLVVDGVRGRGQLPSVRLWAFAVQFLALDVVAVVAAASLWICFRPFGRLRGDASLAWHGRFQWWWTGQVMDAARRCLGLRFVVAGPNTVGSATAGPGARGPLVVLGRHCSSGDALLPLLLFGHQQRMHLRYVIARGLAWDPALDLFGHRLRNHFVDRETAGLHDLLAVGRLARGMADNDAAVIFPEGQFFTVARHQQAMDRMRHDDPARAARLAGLAHLLAPLPGGVLALLGAAPPQTDVVVVGHVGFERYSTLAEVWRNLPFTEPVVVQTWRFAAEQVPKSRRQRMEWLDQRWLDLDQWIAESVAGVSSDRSPGRAGSGPGGRRNASWLLRPRRRPDGT